ncbi:hydroxyacid dehydrogenase [Streptomyces sp. VRA16 Mangrove soil]|uniref:hydroxyacid dehydrogenase n=1 Tax=Streptomyces sp. VRA16 Mangrove soil TaxID=2817434 RepID=UPI001A9E2630|nr:hydroxyacid dehydrogenase [Streptomyces sp. VRA16 Mangrove soil]MBO1330911.1 hydroxyacid dehydrogenase [Streptomyces sp. VRA16 Mangrove soil]
MSAATLPHAFPPPVLARLRELADITPDLVVEDFADPRARAALAEAEVLVTGWGCPPIDAAVLAAAPRLRAVLHAAGSVKSLVTEACWRRGLLISSAAQANALPVAEYTLAMILLAGKGLFALRDSYRATRTFEIGAIVEGVGNHGLRVGVIGASRIGRRLIELLRPFDFEVSLADPYVTEEEAAALGVRPRQLHGPDGLFATSDIVTVHAPQTPETRHLVGRRELALMRDGAVLVNTARGSLVDTQALVGEARTGRIGAILDVTHPEPLPADSPLYDLPNVYLTPHVAGSQGNEIARLGLAVVEEMERLCAGLPLGHPVDHAGLERAA